MRVSEYKLSDCDLEKHNINKKICHNCDQEERNLYFYRSNVFFCWWCINDFKDNIKSFVEDALGRDDVKKIEKQDNL